MNEKRRDCINPQSSTMISENTIFLKFLKRSLLKFDQKADQLSDKAYSFLVKKYLDSSDSEIPAVKKIIAESQLRELEQNMKLPRDIQGSLKNLLFEHISMNSERFPLDSRLVHFVCAKIPDILNYFSKEILECYITLVFIAHSSTEFTDYSMLEIKKKLESNKSETEICNDILITIKQKLSCTYIRKEKLKFLSSMFEELSGLNYKLPAKASKKGNVILYLITMELLLLIDSLRSENTNEEVKSSSLFEDNKILLEEIREEIGLNGRIMSEQIRIADEFDIQILEFQKIEEDIQCTTVNEIEIETNKIKEDIMRYYRSESHENGFIQDQIEEYKNKRLRNIEKLKELNFEQQKLHEIYYQKSIKIQKSYDSEDGIEELLKSDFCEYEYSLFLKERDIIRKETILKKKRESFEMQKARRLRQAPTHAYTNYSCFDKIALNGIFIVLGIMLKLYILD